MTSHPPPEVNKICATCTQPCKQPAYVGLVACVKYEKMPVADKPAKTPKT